MAFVPLVPIGLNVTLQRNGGQQFKSTTAIKNAAGTEIDLSAWDAIEFNLVRPAPFPPAVFMVGTMVGDAAGILTGTITAADLADFQAGSAKLIVTGSSASGDAAQVLANGVATIQ